MFLNLKMVSYDAYIGVLPQSSLARIISESYTTPLGQLLIGTVVKKKCPETEVVIFDPVRTSPEQIYQNISAIRWQHDRILLGLTLLTGNSRAGFEMAGYCSELGVEVIIGGQDVAGYGTMEIMRDRPWIEYGTDGPGEIIVPALVAGTAPEDIAGLTYRDHNNLQQNKKSTTRLDWLNVQVDYSLLDNITGNSGATYLLGNDCAFANKRCYFCGRQPLGNPQTETEIELRVERVWKEIEQARSLGITYYFNSADSALVNFKLFSAFAEAKPDWFNPEFHHLFANAHEITLQAIPLLQKLGATVYMGVENTQLNNYGKGRNSFQTDSLPAIELLHQNNVPMRLSFVFGSTGESEHTLESNLMTITQLVRKYPGITDLELNPLQVLPGTRAYQDLMSEKKDNYTALAKPYDPIEMSRDIIPLISGLSRDKVLEWIKRMYQEIKAVTPGIRVNTKGISQEEFSFLSAA